MVIRVAKSKKKPQKNSKNKADIVEPVVIGVLFIILILVGIYMFYFNNSTAPEPEDNVVAIVNGEEIRSTELDWWFDLSVEDKFQSQVSKEGFLNDVLIPQTVLIQEAKKQGIAVTEDEVDTLIGLYIIEYGLTMEEFQTDIKKRGVSFEDIRKSFEARIYVIKLFEEENLNTDVRKGRMFFDEQNSEIQLYITTRINNADIEVLFTEEMKENHFIETGDKCSDTKVRLFITSSCKSCEKSSNIFKTLVGEDTDARLWELDTGDDLLTEGKEKGIPSEELSFFKKYNSENKVPMTMLGCEYVHIGPLNEEIGSELQQYKSGE